MKHNLIFLILILLCAIVPQVWGANHVLSLDGDGDYVEISDSESLNAINSQVTMEAWIKPTVFPNRWIAIIFKGDERTSDACSNRSYTLWLNRSGSILLASAPSGKGQVGFNSPSGLIALNTWHHIAGVVDAEDGVMKILLNGVEIGSKDFGKDIYVSVLPLRIGESHESGRQEQNPFAGQIDEVRLWNVARTEEQIRDTMFGTLHGDEPGLVGYWQFEGEGEKAIDATKNGHHGEMFGDAKRVAMELPMNPEQVVSDILTVKAQKQIDFKTGLYKLAITAHRFSRVAGLIPLPITIEIYDSANQLLLKGTHTEVGAKQLASPLLTWTVPDDFEGDVRIVARRTDSMGKERTGETIASTRRFGAGKQTGGSMKDKVGMFRNYDYIDGLCSNWIWRLLEADDGALWIGTWCGGVSRFDGQTWQTFNKDDGLAANVVWSMLQTQDRMLLVGTEKGLSRYDGQQWETQMNDDLEGKRVTALLQTNDGALWVGGGDNLLRYDGQQWYAFTKEDGWPGGGPLALLQAQDSTLWAGQNHQLYRYDGKIWQVETDGLPISSASALLQTKDGAIWAGTVRQGGLSRYDGQRLQTFIQHNETNSLLQTRDGMLWAGNYGVLSRYDGQSWRIFTTKDGLTSNNVRSLVETADGTLLIGTWSGLFHYYRGQWQNITTEDGLASNGISSLLQTEDGVIWVGTGGGLCRYDGEEWQTFTKNVHPLAQTSDGALWARGGGLSRYDGQGWINFTTDDGLPANNIRSLLQTSDGALWVGTGGWFNGSLSRYDGQGWQAFEVAPGKGKTALLQSQDGVLWVGVSLHGIFRYDGKEWIEFTEDDGLEGNDVCSLLQATDGTLWVGTTTGLSCYDGESWSSFTQKDGLMGLSVQAILQTSDGKLWLGTRDGGLNVYDGRCFQSINTEDGLLSNSVRSLLQADDGALWVGTGKGISRIIPTKTPPRPWIRRVAADDKSFENPRDEIQVTGSVGRLSVEYRGITFHTRKGGIKYFTQLVKVGQTVSLPSVGQDSEVRDFGYPRARDGWSKPTNDERVEYTNLAPGEYTFKMQAVDRWLNYSEIANLTIKIVPPFYMRAIFLAPIISFGALLLATLVILATALIKRRRQVRAYERAAVEELQDAREMQMGLMPETALPIEGIEIAGKCLPANTVGGDFFDYLHSERNGEIALVIADVTGKALKGAMNAVMTDGVLRMAVDEMENLSPGVLMMKLNNVLKTRMERNMNVTMVIGVIDVAPNSGEFGYTLTLANAGHHAYPILLHDGEIQSLQAKGMPLGMMAGIEYDEEQFLLQGGDVLILMTDGIIEAMDSAEDYYADSGRLEKTISQFTQDMPAEAMVNAIIEDAMNYGGDKTTRDDDMTVVVAKID